jgi:hypothetical protein
VTKSFWPSKPRLRREPVDDLVAQQITQFGEPSPGCPYLGKINGHWIGVPTCYGSSDLPPCAPIDRFKEYVGLDVTEMYPPPGIERNQRLIDNWTWECFLTAAEKCFKAGYPFGLTMSTATDGVNTNDSIFASHVVRLVDVEGNITVRSDGTRQMLEYFRGLTQFLPERVFAWEINRRGRQRLRRPCQTEPVEDRRRLLWFGERKGHDIELK